MRSEVRRDSHLFRQLSQVLLKRGISVRFVAAGRSMFPAIEDGDTVQVDPEERVASGDVLLVDSTEGFKVHRLMRPNDGTIATKGDSCVEMDEVTPSATVMGRVSQVIGAKGTRSTHTWRTYVGRLTRLFHR